MKYIENIVIGEPLVDSSDIFGLNQRDWTDIESEKTHYTN